MIINLLSSPRTVSTSLMYSFDNRADTIGMDEPFYAYYLQRTGKIHPGGEEVLIEQPTSLDTIFQSIEDQQKRVEHVFVKNMAHHMIDVSLDRFIPYVNVFLIRDPRRIVASFSKNIERPELLDIGVHEQWKLYQELKEKGLEPHIVDSTEILKAPRQVLTTLCEGIGIEFSETMLKWEAGARAIDGSWAKYWYASTHKSTGFAPYTAKDVELTDHGNMLYEEAKPFYEKLFAASIHNL